jgi:hypothetical protein
MDSSLFQKLHEEGLLADSSLNKIKALEKDRLFSLHWELKTVLYLGVTLLSGGLGVLVYKNIDRIGHLAVLLFIALVCAGCFFYCLRKKAPFSVERVTASDPFFDYILLLACLTLLTFIGYLQFQYDVFGQAYGLATAIPMLILFFCAYYFDHLGVLSLAITNLAAWAGISITPASFLKEGIIDHARLIYTGLALGVLLVLAGLTSVRRNFKQHFAFTYTNFGIHILFVAGLSGLFSFDPVYILWFILLLGIAYYFYRYAVKQGSFYFLLVTMLYAYIALSYVICTLLAGMSFRDLTPIVLGLIYFIVSAIGVVRILIALNHKMKAHDSL